MLARDDAVELGVLAREDAVGLVVLAHDDAVERELAVERARRGG